MTYIEIILELGDRVALGILEENDSLVNPGWLAYLFRARIRREIT